MADPARPEAQNTDDLTGLPNRQHLENVVNSLLGGHLTRKRPLSLLLFDIDRFESVNDFHGREVGDQVLRSVAMILRSNVKSGDPVVRCGGDEFAIVLEDVAKDVAERVGARVVDRLVDGPQEALGRRVDIVVSVGVATFPEDGSDLSTLLASASGALAERRKTAS